MTLQFPASPSLNETYTASNDLIYKWDGEKWITTGSSADSNTYVRNDIDNTYAGLISATGTEAFGVPVGTTAEQPTNADGLLRYNSTLNRYEGSSDGSWGALGGGATGGGSDRVFQLNTMVCTTDFTLPDGESALSAGPIEIEDGVTITINDDSSWVIL